MKLLKRIALSGTLIVCLFSLAACYGSQKVSVGNGKGREDSEKLADATSGDVGNYKVVIYADYEIMKLYDGVDVLVMTYDFTNNSDENKTFSDAINDNVFQNGISLYPSFKAVIWNLKRFEGSSTEVQPKSTVTLQKAYILRDVTSPISVEITAKGFNNQQKITKELNLQ